MSTDVIPFIQWGSFPSRDKQNPDILNIEVVSLEQWESEFSINVHVKLEIHDSWEDRILPLKSHDSRNSMLLKKWKNAVNKKQIKPGTRLSIHTFMGKSKNDNPMRHYDLIF